LGLEVIGRLEAARGWSQRLANSNPLPRWDDSLHRTATFNVVDSLILNANWNKCSLCGHGDRWDENLAVTDDRVIEIQIKRTTWRPAVP
jgi:hypothetical protein